MHGSGLTGELCRREASDGCASPAVRRSDGGAQRPLQQAAQKQSRQRKLADQPQTLQIDGVGPVGASKLRGQGWTTLEHLSAAFRQTFKSDPEALKKHLKASCPACAACMQIPW